MRLWLLSLVVVFGMALSLGRLATAEPAKSDPPLGTPVDLAPFKGELFVWETGLELVVRDSAGVVLPPRKVVAKARVTRLNGAPSALTAAFEPRQTDVRAELDLAGARALEVTIEVTVGGRVGRGTVSWRLAADRSRLNDGLKL